MSKLKHLNINKGYQMFRIYYKLLATQIITDIKLQLKNLKNNNYSLGTEIKEMNPQIKTCFFFLLTLS
jgi:hypothetical protein